MTTCPAETTVDGETIECEHEAGHDGPHEGHIPDEDKSGLLWVLHQWGREQ